MALVPYALSIALLASAAAPALADTPYAAPGTKVIQLHICDQGPFKRSAWNREFGRVEFLRPDRPRDPAPRAEDPKVRCITEKNLARLKARQTGDLRVIDARERR